MMDTLGETCGERHTHSLSVQRLFSQPFLVADDLIRHEKAGKAGNSET